MDFDWNTFQNDLKGALFGKVEGLRFRFVLNESGLDQLAAWMVICPFEDDLVVSEEEVRSESL